MFNWWSRRSYLEDIPSTVIVTPPSESGYTVGVDEDGETMLCLMCDATTVTIRMDANGVRRMIRLLAAAIEEAE